MRCGIIEPDHPELSVRRQCELAGLCRSSFYYEPAAETALNLTLMRLLDEEYTRYPFYGSPRMTAYLRGQGYGINHKRVERLMQQMGLQAIAPGPQTSRPGAKAAIYPYLLRGMDITSPLQVYAADITYIRMVRGFMYLVAILDWYSRYVVGWALSNTLDAAFCLEALEQALAHGVPSIFNTDQGTQFTSEPFTDALKGADIRISMDGRGRCFDNIFVERLWRSLKYEDIYLHDYATVAALEQGLDAYFSFYNHERPHQSLDYRVPAQVFAER
jgi:putative transposase